MASVTPRIAPFALAGLLLLAQLTGTALELCLEEDGRVTIELSGGCGGADSPSGCDGMVAWVGSGLSKDDCPCQDFRLGVLFAAQKEVGIGCCTLPDPLPRELPANLLSEPGLGTEGMLLTRAQAALPWLEHEDVLARSHASGEVEMRC